MQPLLEIKAFFFNAKTDYLPYYKHFSLELSDTMSVGDLLAFIQTQNETFSYPKERLLLKINGWIIETPNKPLSEVVARLGTSLTIDPVNSYRSVNGLCINDSDFMQSYELLAPYASQEDLDYYQKLYPLHYASETEKFERDYIGDAILLLAYKMISDGSEHKTAILEAITSVPTGLFACEYENNLFDAQDHTTTLTQLKAMVPAPKPFSLIEKITQFCGQKKLQSQLSQPITLAGKKVAYYQGDTIVEVSQKITAIKEAGATYVPFERASRLSGLSLLATSPQLAYQKAGTTLLDALDRGAEVVLVEDSSHYEMFQNHLANIQRVMGREIPLAIALASEHLEA